MPIPVILLVVAAFAATVGMCASAIREFWRDPKRSLANRLLVCGFYAAFAGVCLRILWQLLQMLLAALR